MCLFFASSSFLVLSILLLSLISCLRFLCFLFVFLLFSPIYLFFFVSSSTHCLPPFSLSSYNPHLLFLYLIVFSLFFHSFFLSFISFLSFFFMTVLHPPSLSFLPSLHLPSVTHLSLSPFTPSLTLSPYSSTLIFFISITLPLLPLLLLPRSYTSSIFLVCHPYTYLLLPSSPLMPSPI